MLSLRDNFSTLCCSLLLVASFNHWACAADHLAAPKVADRAKQIKVLIVDGQNNHQWQITTPIMREFYDECELFSCDVATSPAKGEDMSGFRPRFADYEVIVSNYNGQLWPRDTQVEFEAFVRGGGGFVVVHAANNSFSGWPEYNEMIGLGGWGGRNKSSGPYAYFKDDKLVIDTETKGGGGAHGSQHEFLVTTRDADHPIMRGLPATWLHTKDELYDRLRGPAKNMNVLATSYADPAQRGSGRDEPMVMTLSYEQGRIFHTPMGHADYSMRCQGFKTLLLRGTEWAATGKVTLPIPKDFPTKEMTSPLPTAN